MASIFSRIIQGEIPCHRVAESEEFLAFLDIRPIRPGHTLVVPKREIDQFFWLPDDLLTGLMLFAKPIARAIQMVTGAERVSAAVAGFDVPHAHLHLIPADSMMDLDFSRQAPADPDALAEMAGRIREVLGH